MSNEHPAVFASPHSTWTEFGSRMRDAIEAGFKVMYAIVSSPSGDIGICCGKCEKTSWNHNDVINRYCPACHEYLDERVRHAMDSLLPGVVDDDGVLGRVFEDVLRGKKAPRGGGDL